MGARIVVIFAHLTYTCYVPVDIGECQHHHAHYCLLVMSTLLLVKGGAG